MKKDFEPGKAFTSEDVANRWIDGVASSKAGGSYSWATGKATKPKKLPPLKKGIANEIRVSVRNIYVEGKRLDLAMLRKTVKDAQISVELDIEHRGAGMNLKMGKWKGYDLSIYASDLVD